MPDTSAPPGASYRYKYRPFPKQLEFHRCKSDEVLFGGAGGPGKRLPMTAKVLTPKGWVLNGDLQAGDSVVDPRTGRTNIILIAHTPEMSDVWEVEFNDGTVTEACGDHLWTFRCSGKRAKGWDRRRELGEDDPWLRGYKVGTTRNLAAAVARAVDQVARGVKNPCYPHIPVARATQFTRGYRNINFTLPIDPYVLGLYLGDGWVNGKRITICSDDAEIHTACRDYAEREGFDYSEYHEPEHRGRPDTYWIDSYSSTRDLGYLAEQGLKGKRAWEKFIPPDYLFAPLEYRQSLMQGLMDTDGYVDRRDGRMSYCTTSSRLATDVATLARSLGGTAKITTKIPVCNGKPGRLAYNVWMTAHEPETFVRLTRKRNLVRDLQNAPSRTVVAVRETGRQVMMRCITVDNTDGLYITDNFVVTHNTDAVLARAVTMCLAIPNVKVLLLRRRSTELEQEIIPRLRQRVPPWIAVYSTQRKVFVFRHNQARLFLGYLERDDDMYQYIGAEYQLIIWDELTQHNRKPYVFLRSRLRMAGQVAVDMRRMGWRPQMISTSNPTGRGHGWVKAMFVDPAPPGVEHVVPLGEKTMDGHDGDGLTRTYIPARARDNPALDLVEYEKLLMSLDPDMRRAIMDGDWSVLEGVRFSQFRYGIHVIKPEEVPISMVGYPLGVGVDWGIRDPFVALWGAVLPDRRVIVYRELHQTNLTSSEQARLIRNSERPDERTPARAIPIALDPSCWSRQSESGLPPVDPNTPPVGSIAHYYREVFGAQVRKAENARKSGWALVDEYLRVRDDGLPGVLIYDTCVNLIRTLPAVQRDKNDPEDVATHDDDHDADAFRYLLQLLVGGGHDRTDTILHAGTNIPRAEAAAIGRAAF